MNTTISRKQTSFRLSEELTLSAMADAERGHDLETLDLKDFRNFVQSL